MNCSEIMMIAPEKAYDLLQNMDKSLLIDVRTSEELSQDGRVDMSAISHRIYHIEWTHDFIDKLKEQIEDRSSPLLFLCAGGIRSGYAATQAKDAGYHTCYNVTGGFKHPEVGWKYKQLPWKV